MALKTANQNLEKMAYRDPVTGLPNNSQYLKDLTYLNADMNNEDFALHQVLIELIDFADINIKYGIEVGNELLRSGAKRLQALPDCTVYRDPKA